MCGVVNGKESTLGCVLSGIPQDSVLGLLLFVLYINDILDNIRSEGFLFADNNKIFKEITERLDAEFLQDDIDSLSTGLIHGIRISTLTNVIF